MTTFDKQLSISIDAVHHELDALTYQRGLRATLRRWWLYWRLRRLERQVPQ